MIREKFKQIANIDIDIGYELELQTDVEFKR